MKPQSLELSVIDQLSPQEKVHGHAPFRGLTGRSACYRQFGTPTIWGSFWAFLEKEIFDCQVGSTTKNRTPIKLQIGLRPYPGAHCPFPNGGLLLQLLFALNTLSWWFNLPPLA